jgi:hypothetical protein
VISVTPPLCRPQVVCMGVCVGCCVWCAAVRCECRVRCGVLWCDVVCCCMVRCDVLWCFVLWCVVVCGVLWWVVLWCMVVCCGVFWCVLMCVHVAEGLRQGGGVGCVLRQEYVRLPGLVCVCVCCMTPVSFVVNIPFSHSLDLVNEIFHSFVPLELQLVFVNLALASTLLGTCLVSLKVQKRNKISINSVPHSRSTCSSKHLP